MRAWREGDHGSGQILFKRHYRGVVRFFANKVSESPHDLAQETFMACVKGRDRIRSEGSFRSYLFGVAYKVLSGYLRSKYSLSGDQSSISLCDLNPGPSTLMRRLEQDHLLLDALRRLPLDLQVVIELRYWEKMSSAEISPVLGVSASAIRDRLQKGRLLLKQSMLKSTPGPSRTDARESDIEVWAEEIRMQMGRQEDTAAF